MKAGARIFALLVALALVTESFSSNAFQDPLDKAATKSRLASRVLLNGIAVAGKRLVAVGQRGHIVYSDDSGKNWMQASSVPVSSDLTAVYFASPQKGWAVGHDGVVLATSDSGNTWVKQLDGRQAAKILEDHYAAHPPIDMPGGAEALAQFETDVKRLVEEGPEKSFLDVWFENESTGYVVGIFNLIFRTTDGGKNWTPWFDHTDNPKRLHFYAIHPVGGEVYLAGEQGMVLKFDAATQRFRAVPTGYKGTFFGITDSGPSVLVFGLRGNVFRSDDSGAHWQKIETGVTVAITAAAHTTDGRVVLVSQSGQVLVSADGGRTFTQIRVDRASAGAAVSVVPRELVIAGARGVRIQPITQ